MESIVAEIKKVVTYKIAIKWWLLQLWHKGTLVWLTLFIWVSNCCLDFHRTPELGPGDWCARLTPLAPYSGKPHCACRQVPHLSLRFPLAYLWELSCHWWVSSTGLFMLRDTFWPLWALWGVLNSGRCYHSGSALVAGPVFPWFPCWTEQGTAPLILWLLVSEMY